MAEPLHDAIRCPECRAWMTAGFVAVSQGIHWMRRAEGSYNDFAQGVPGTHSVLRPNRLPAWRCHHCRNITFRYGHDVQRRREQAGRIDTAPSGQAEVSDV